MRPTALFRLSKASSGLLLLIALAAGCASTPPFNGDDTTGTTGGDGGPPSLAPGKACSANTDCDSGICGIDGSGNCCFATCSTADATCGAGSCDTSGACVYPQPGTSCPGACVGQALTTNACNGNGACNVISTTACPNEFICGDDGGCRTSCASAADCSGGFGCNAGVCVRPVATGPCTENDDCTSGFCGINGTGNCCRVPCTNYAPPCGATTCDATGACIYPPATTACGTILAGCSNGVQQNPSLCDGDGGCNDHPTTVVCEPFICGPNACFTGCTDDSSCEPGLFCDADDANCCPDLLAGQKMTVDAVSGNDSAACCGMQGNPPCRTLRHVMHLVDEAGVEGLTIQASIGKTGGTWNPPNEAYPIILGWGVVLNASGVFFSDPASPGHSAIFDIRHYSARDTIGKASLIGSAGAVHVGTDSQGTPSLDRVAIEVEPGNALYLASAAINSNSESKTTAIRVEAGARLVLGADQSGFVHGTVIIGRAVADAGIDGWAGIVCGYDAGQGCTISDIAVAGGSLLMQGQQDIDIDAEDFASITLSASPVIGQAPAAGFGGCPGKTDVGASNGAAVLLRGSATVLYSGSVQCIAGTGFDLKASAIGTPTLTLSKATIQNTETALHASAGSATVSNTTIQFNYNGVVEDSDGVNPVAIDLSGGKLGGTNTLICSNSYESVFDGGTPSPGVCLRNDTTQTIDANNVAWDTSKPDVFTCDPTLSDCSCDFSSCSDVDAGGEGRDIVLVEEDAGVGAVTTTGNSLSATACTVPSPLCNGQQCTNGEICCFEFGEQFCDFPEFCNF